MHHSMTTTAPLLFAKTDHRASHRVFGIFPDDLLRHVYVVGKTGAGKTALLEHLVLAEIRAGRGCAVLDPHGDLAARLLDLIPRRRLNDVVLLDPSDADHPIGLNVLEQVPYEHRPLVASGVLAVFRKVFSEFWGPRLEHVFRNCLLALLDVRGGTLLGVLRMLVEERYREIIVAQVRDPIVRFYWTTEFPTYPRNFLPEVVAPVQNKVAAVLTSPILRNIIGQHRTAFSPRTIMDEGKILIANLAKGRIGEDASALLGAILVSKFQLAAYSRATVPEAQRRPFTIYVDEFPSFVTRSFGELLAEARKYGLALVLAHQHLGQIDDALRAAVLGNVGTIVCFRLGGEDAKTLGSEFSPEFSAEDLTRLSRYQIALRLSVEGSTSHPFTAVTLPPHGDAEREGHADTIRRVSRERYGRPRVAVEAAVMRQLAEGRSETLTT